LVSVNRLGRFVGGKLEMPMLKVLIVSLCLMAGLVAMSGCHAAVETDKGHGAAVGVG